MLELALAAILVPALGGALMPGLPQRASRPLGQVCAAVATVCMWAICYLFSTSGREAVSIPLLHMGNTEIFGITIDRVSTLVGLAVVSIGFLIQIYSNGYISPLNKDHPDHVRRRYFIFMTIFIGAMAGLVFSSTIVGQLFFFEITGLCSWGLIGYYQTDRSFYAAGKALIITHIASLGLYAAAAVLFAGTGTFALSAMDGLSWAKKGVVVSLVLFAAWGKSAQWPLYMWLPDAMEAPTPVSAYLHAASMVKVGVYIYARSLMAAHHMPLFVGYVGTVMATITLVFGFLMYLPQTDMKRLLAYSTITQLAYMFLGLSLFIFGSQLAFDGAVAHLFNHAFAKTLFFLVAGALSYATGTRLLPEFRGIIHKFPLVGVAFIVAALAIAGVPPFNGFFSKFTIFAGGFAVAATHPALYVCVVIALLESVGTFAWFLKWIGACVFGAPSPKILAASPLPLSMRAVLALLIVMSVVSSFIAASWLG